MTVSPQPCSDYPSNGQAALLHPVTLFASRQRAGRAQARTSTNLQTLPEGHSSLHQSQRYWRPSASRYARTPSCSWRDTHVLCCFYLYFWFSRWDSQEPHQGKSHANLQSGYPWQNPQNSLEKDVVPDKRQEGKGLYGTNTSICSPFERIGKGVTSQHTSTTVLPLRGERCLRRAARHATAVKVLRWGGSSRG